MTSVDALRERIAALDVQIVECIAERVEVARRIGAVKRDAGGATLDPGREAVVIRHAVEVARNHDLPVEPVREIFWTLMELCRTAQMEQR